MCCAFGKEAETISTLNSPEGSSASWRAGPPQPAATSTAHTMTRRRIVRKRTIVAVPSLPVPEGLERDGVVLRRLRARDAGPFAAAFRDDPELGVVIGADEDPTEN